MNIKVLDKLEGGYIKFTWREYINRANFKSNDLETIVDIIDTFKDNSKTKEIIVFRLKTIPAYVAIERHEYVDILKWIKNRFIELEMYEQCDRIVNIIKIL
jgi:wyosine [tRNA(Phe)-imidazoG37] synthetase (radical SAM superfamily)